MKKFNILLFYYCAMMALFISVSGIISAQTVSSLALQVVFIPVPLYFLYIVSLQFIDKKDSFQHPSYNRGVLFFTIVVFFILVTTGVVRLIHPPKSSKTSQIKPTILQPSPQITIVPYISAKNEYKNEQINIRASDSTTSKIIGKLSLDKSYRVVSKKDGWFQIELETNKYGFVSDQFVALTGK